MFHRQHIHYLKMLVQIFIFKKLKNRKPNQIAGPATHQNLLHRYAFVEGNE